MEFIALIRQLCFIFCLTQWKECTADSADEACFVDPSAIITSDDMFEVYNFAAEEGILLEPRKLLGTVILSGNGSDLYTFDEPYFESPRNLKVNARPQHFDIVFKDISSSNESTTVEPPTATTTAATTMTTTTTTTTATSTTTTSASVTTPFPSPAVNSTTAIKSRPKRFYEDSTGSAGDQISNTFKAYTDSTFTETSIYTTAVTRNQIRTDYTTDEASTADSPVRCVKAYIYQVYDLDRETQNTHYLTINTMSSSFLSIPILVVINVTDINDNTPIFDQGSLTTTIRNNTATGLIVGHIKAEDADIGQNADLRYDIQFPTERRGDANASSFLPSVLVQRTTGIVVLVRSVEDLKPPSKLTFSVVVKDNGDKHVCNRATATATISIVDVISSRTMHPSSPSPSSGTIGIAVGCSVAGVLLIAIIVMGIYRYRRNRVQIQNDGALQFMLDDETLVSA